MPRASRLIVFQGFQIYFLEVSDTVTKIDIYPETSLEGDIISSILLDQATLTRKPATITRTNRPIQWISWGNFDIHLVTTTDGIVINVYDSGRYFLFLSAPISFSTLDVLSNTE